MSSNLKSTLSTKAIRDAIDESDVTAFHNASVARKAAKAERRFPYNVMPTNRVLDTDSYKLSHAGMYPKEVRGMFSYIEARTKGDTIVPFGLQMWLQKALLTPITAAEVDEAEEFAKAHGEPFDREPWDYLIREHKGYLPLKIRAVPEGQRVPSGHVIVSVEVTDPKLFWLASYIETSLQRAVWYPTTIASNDYKAWRVIKRFMSESADTNDLVPFMLHDFGGRGGSSEETIQIGAASHLVFFQGSDSISGVRAANFYYGTKGGMAAFSVPATEHSVQCSYGPMRQHEYLANVIATAKPGSIVSIVIDGYDTIREARYLCFELKETIIASGARVVFRPDSGDPLEIVPALLRLQEAAFGATVNKKGYKVINNVGVIQGDGVDLESMTKILEKVTEMGYSAQNVVFGSGGALLQKVNRDTYKFAQKASAILVGKQWIPIFKDPVTDPGKRSKAGRLTLVRSRLTGEYTTLNIDDGFDSEYIDQMKTVYENGKLFNVTTLDEVRARAMGRD
jgi:nicotinamide phosphoribosyltransferase